MKDLRYRVEAILLRILFAAFRALPLEAASATGGFLGRLIGPFLSAQRIAVRNLSMIFPEMTEGQRRTILTGMWDNLGRTAAELARLASSELFTRMTIEGEEYLPSPGAPPVIFFSGHMGNWEMSYPVVHRHGIPIALIYRAANNPYVDDIISRIRATHCTTLFPKGKKGAVRLGRAIKNGQSLAMLIDQKMNDGISVPFFGREAMTAPAIAEFAVHYGMPIIPGRVIRLKGCRFKSIIYPPLVYEKTGDNEKDILAIMTQINAMLESWIREIPDQWFWVHKRWPN